MLCSSAWGQHCVTCAARGALAALRGPYRSRQPAERPLIHAECCLVRAGGAYRPVIVTVAVTMTAVVKVAVAATVAVAVSTSGDSEEAATAVTESRMQASLASLAQLHALEQITAFNPIERLERAVSSAQANNTKAESGIWPAQCAAALNRQPGVGFGNGKSKSQFSPAQYLACMR